MRLLLAAVAAVMFASVGALPAAAQDPPPPRVAAAPTGLTAEASRDTVTLSWDDPGDDTVTGYVILRRDKATQAVGVFSTVVADTGTAHTTYVDAYVERNRRYVYRVQAINSTGVSERSRWARGYTPRWLNSPEQPAKPRGLIAEAAHDQVTLSWDDPGDDSITGYVILRRDKDTHDKGIFATLDPDTGTAATAYVDATARPDRHYIYRVKALNTAGHSQTAWTRGYTPTAPASDDTTGDDTGTDGTEAEAGTGSGETGDSDTTADDDTSVDGDTDSADDTETASAPQPEPPRWVRGFVTSFTHAETDPDALAEPTRFRAQVASFDNILVNLRWDHDSDADGHKVYVLATRDGIGRWVDPMTDSGIDITDPSNTGAILQRVSSDDTPPGIDDHLIIALAAYSDPDGDGYIDAWSHWRIAAVKWETGTLSYDLYDEGITSF
ncbi:fibronectin type III domain-containing protein [Candidatus Poriferisodalis sp.]|uniref:fibronectin type III domain-containing protein n=1 Tax=Candidatus Poriferisodalis sp. TaxID=3101277 RepID=UPI003B5CB177